MSTHISSNFGPKWRRGMHCRVNEAFKYWAGEEPWEAIDVKNGQYWWSNHFTKEHIMYMEVIVPKTIALDFINDSYNKMEAFEGEATLPDNCLLYTSDAADD